MASYIILPGYVDGLSLPDSAYVLEYKLSTSIDDFDSAQVSVLISTDDKYTFETYLRSDNLSITVFDREFYVFGFSFSFDVNLPKTLNYTLDLRNHYTKWLDLPVRNEFLMFRQTITASINNVEAIESNCSPPQTRNPAIPVIGAGGIGVYGSLATETERAITISQFLDGLRLYYNITSVNFQVTGIASALIYIEKNRNSITTFGDCLSQLRGYGLYVTFLGLEIRIEEALNEGEYSPDYILDSNFSENIQVFPRIIPPILVEYKERPIEENNDTGLTVTRPTFYAIPTISSRSVSGDPNPSECPSDINTLYTLDLNFDASGVKKVKIEGEYKNNLPIKETITTYGFKYLAIDIARSTSTGFEYNASASNFWGVVEQKTIIYEYDLPKYYYLGMNIRGFKFTRFQVEAEDTPISFEYDYTQLGDSPSPEDLAYADFQLSLVKFVSTPLSGEEKVILTPFHRIYKDLPYESPFIYYESCNAIGETVLRPIENLNYALPRLQIAKTTYESCYRFLRNPENDGLTVTDLKLPDYTTGKETETTEYLQVFKTQNTVHSLNYTTNSLFGNVNVNIIHNPNSLETNVSEDKYITYTRTTSTQEGSFKNYVSTITNSVSTGRPSPVTYRELFQREDLTIEPPEQRRRFTIGGDIDMPLKIASDHFIGKINYLAPTSTINIRLRGGRSLIYERAKKVLIKQELSSSNTATFQIPLNTSTRLGESFFTFISDILEEVKGTIISISHSVSVIDNTIKGITTITINKDVYLGESLTTTYIQNTSNGNNGGLHSNSANGDDLGQIRSTIYINRGNRG